MKVNRINTIQYTSELSTFVEKLTYYDLPYKVQQDILNKIEKALSLKSISIEEEFSNYIDNGESISEKFESVFVSTLVKNFYQDLFKADLEKLLTVVIAGLEIASRLFVVLGERGLLFSLHIGWAVSIAKCLNLNEQQINKCIGITVSTSIIPRKYRKKDVDLLAKHIEIFSQNAKLCAHLSNNGFHNFMDIFDNQISFKNHIVFENNISILVKELGKCWYCCERQKFTQGFLKN